MVNILSTICTRKSLLFLCLSVASVVFFSTPAYAGIEEWNIDFDDYSTGLLEGQNGWLNSNCQGAGAQVTTETGAVGKAVVCDDNAASSNHAKVFSHDLNVYDTFYVYGRFKVDDVGSVSLDGQGVELQLQQDSDNSNVCNFGIQNYVNGVSSFFLEGSTTIDKTTELTDLPAAGQWYWLAMEVDVDLKLCRLVTSTQTTSWITWENNSITDIDMMYIVFNDNSDGIETGKAVDAFYVVEGSYGSGAGGQDLDVDATWAIITAPARDTPYNTFFEGLYNMPYATSATTSYRLSLISQTNQDYSSFNLVGSTTDKLSAYFSGNITFPADDIVYVRIYLYDSDSIGGVPYYISPEFEWWVSANGSSTQTIDLGIFRTGATSTCADASTWSGGLCHAMRLLFVPSESSLQAVKNQVANATSSSPFVYIYEIGQYVDTFQTATATAWSVTVPSTTDFFGGMELLSSSDIQSATGYDMFRNVTHAGLYIILFMYVIKRTRRILS